MRASILRWGTALLLCTGAASIAANSVRAQYAPPQQPSASQDTQKPGTAGKPGANGAPPAAPAVNKEEEDAYKAIYAARTGDAAKQIQMGEEFLKKFPDTHYAAGGYSQLTTAYMATGQEDKMFVAGSKTLELNPDNIDVLPLMAMAVPRRVRASTPDATQQLQKAETYAKHSLELIPNIPKPEGMDEAAFAKAKNEKLSMAHSGLGLVYYQRQKYSDALGELSQAVQLSSNPDPVDYFLLGNADVQTSHYSDAVAAYEKCASGGPLAAQCKARQDDAKKKSTTELSAPK